MSRRPWSAATRAGRPAQTVRATYLDIPQQPRRYGVLQPAHYLGRRDRCTQGVAIGNEAVFSKRVERKGQSLLGMDLLRLGLSVAALRVRHWT